jgi:hypothetical protein
MELQEIKTQIATLHGAHTATQFHGLVRQAVPFIYEMQSWPPDRPTFVEDITQALDVPQVFIDNFPPYGEKKRKGTSGQPSYDHCLGALLSKCQTPKARSGYGIFLDGRRGQPRLEQQLKDKMEHDFRATGRPFHREYPIKGVGRVDFFLDHVIPLEVKAGELVVDNVAQAWQYGRALGSPAQLMGKGAKDLARELARKLNVMLIGFNFKEL